MSKVRSRGTKDPDLLRFMDRVEKREQRHGNWRQVYVDCMGMCQYPIESLGICGELDGLEFHEQFGEDKKREGKFPKRVLLCNYHHWSVHGEKWVNKRFYPSMLQIDVRIEMLLAGGYREWLTKYNLIEREVDNVIKMDSKKYSSDLYDSSD